MFSIGGHKKFIPKNKVPQGTTLGLLLFFSYVNGSIKLNLKDKWF